MRAGAAVERAWRPRAWLTAAAIGAAWLLALLNLYYFRVADPDFWVHIRCGADILASGTIRQVDTYSFTAAGLPLINHEWGAQVLLAWFFQQGQEALIGLKMAAGTACLVVLWRLLRAQTARAAIVLPLFILGAHVLGRSLLFRPQIVSYLFLLVVVAVLERRRRHATGWVWALPPLFALWANMHGAFPVGLGLLGYYGLLMRDAGGGRLRLGAVLAGACLATLANPYGVTLWSRIIETATDPVARQYVQEWQPVWVDAASWDNLLVFALTGVALVAAILCPSRRWAETLLVAGSAAFGWSSTRQLPLFAIVALPLCAKWLAGGGAGGRLRAGVLAGTWGVALLPAVVTARAVVADMRPRITVVDSHYRGFPRHAVDFLRAQPVGGRVWNELAWGGYMIWTLSPQWQVSLDGRNVNVYPAEVLRDHLELFASAAPDLTVLDRYPIDVCLFSRERALAAALEASDGWERIYADDKAVAFVNRASPLAAQLVRQPEPARPAR